MEIKICRHLDLSFVQFRPHLDYHVSSSAVIRIFYVKFRRRHLDIFRRRHLDIACQDAPPPSGYCMSRCAAAIWIFHVNFRCCLDFSFGKCKNLRNPYYPFGRACLTSSGYAFRFSSLSLLFTIPAQISSVCPR